MVLLLCIHSQKARILQYPFPESGSTYLSLSVSLTDFNSVKKKNISLNLTDWKLKHHWVYMIHLRLYRNCLKQTLHLSFPNVHLMSCLLNLPSGLWFLSHLWELYFLNNSDLLLPKPVMLHWNQLERTFGALVIMGINTSANIHAEESPCWPGTRKSRSLFALLWKSFGWQGVQWIWKSWELKYNQLALLNARLVLEGALCFTVAVMQACI